MPIYTYLCEECGTEFEAFASIKKKEQGWKPVCPKCGSPLTRHTYRSVAIVASAKRSSSGGSCCPVK